MLWHPLGLISSKSGVQQVDPLGPLLFALVFQKLVSSLDADDECAEILLQAWYLDNGALAGTRSAVLCALHLIEDLAWACTWSGMSSRWPLGGGWGLIIPVDPCAHSAPVLLLILLVTMQ